MKMTLMGTGTSHGVPVIGCSCPVCTSSDPRDKRLRCSAYIWEPCRLVVDTGPEFRIQALRYKVENPEAVFITHSHADHLNGLDDLRIFSHTESVDPSKPGSRATEGEGLAIYANSNTIRDIRNRFDYIFMPVREGGGKPKLHLIDSSAYTKENPVNLNGLKVVPVPLLHGSLNDNGYLFVHGQSSIAYLTDCSQVPDSSVELIKSIPAKLEHLVIDGLRKEPHSTHFSFMQALSAAERLGARHTWLTHLTHNKAHVQVNEYIEANLNNFPGLVEIVRKGGTVQAAYDGLVLETE